jgi:hypothetical protein
MSARPEACAETVSLDYRWSRPLDLLLHEGVASALGRQRQIDAIVNALRLVRMRVPLDQVNKVVTLIADQNATSCRSLPKAARAGPEGNGSTALHPNCDATKSKEISDVTGRPPVATSPSPGPPEAHRPTSSPPATSRRAG